MTPEAVKALLTGLGLAGFGGFIIALIKVWPQREGISITAMQGVRVVQDSVIERLEKENSRLSEQNNRLSDRLDALEAEADRYQQMQLKMKALEEENEKLRTERQDLLDRISKLEDQVREIKNGG